MIGTSQQPDPAPQHWFTTAVAVVVLAAAAAACAVMAVPGRSFAPGVFGTLYTGHHRFLVGLLAFSGLLLLLVRRQPYAGAVAVAGTVTAAQLACTGVWAARHWKPIIGMAGYPEANLDEVRTLAVTLAAVAALAALACLETARRSGVWRPARAPGDPWRLRLLIGAAVSVAVLPVLGLVELDFLARKIATQALLYSLPWGLAIAACVRLHRAAAVAAAVAVGLSALVRAELSVAALSGYAPISHGLPEPVAFTGVGALAVGVIVLTAARTYRPRSPER